ncbi:MAG: hypothetical protein WEB52_07695 [Dehalococcoidia bacterium]
MRTHNESIAAAATHTVPQHSACCSALARDACDGTLDTAKEVRGMYIGGGLLVLILIVILLIILL